MPAKADEALRGIFAKFARNMGNVSGSAMYVDPDYNEEILIHKMCICTGPCIDETKPKGKVVQFMAGVDLLDVALPQNFRPEVLLDSEVGCIELTDDMKEALMQGACLIVVPRVPANCPYKAGIWLVKPSADLKSSDFIASILESNTLSQDTICSRGVSDFSCRCIEGLDKATNDKISLSVGLIRGSNPVLVLTGVARIVILTMVGTESGFLAEVRLPDGNSLIGDAMDSETKQYKKFIYKRNKTMSVLKNLGNPARAKLNIKPVAREGEEQPIAEMPANLGEVAMPAPTAQADPNVVDVQASDAQEILAEVEEAAVANAQEAAPAKQAAVTAAPEEEPEAEAPTLEVVEPDEVAKDAAAVAAEAPVKRRQRTPRAPKPIGLNIEEMIEKLSAPVEDFTPDQIEKALEEVSAISSLQMAAIKRLNSLVKMTIKMSDGALKKYAQLQAMFAGK